MKKGIAVLLTLVLVGGAGAGGYYYWFHMRGQSSSGERVSSDSEDAVYVDSVSTLAGLGSGNGLIQRYAGVIEPLETWEVKLENERTVDECFVEEGDEVTTGQKLFTYDTTEDEDKVAQAEIDLERLKNEKETSEARLAQLQKEKNSASADDQLNYTIQIASEEASISANEYDTQLKEREIEQLKATIADATVTCEIDGVVKSINDPNSTSADTTSDSAYITVIQVGDYRVKGTVNEQNMDQITEGMEMIVHSRVDETITWRGTITEINRDQGETNSESSYYGMSSDTGTSSTNYPYYVELDSSEGLMLGQHVYMEPDMGQEDVKEGIWLDDYYFVTEEDGSTWVWAASDANVLEKRAVTLGEYDEDMATCEVLEGLAAEDYIIVPTEELAEGLPVIYNEYSDAGTYDEAGMDGEDGLYVDGEENLDMDGLYVDGEEDLSMDGMYPEDEDTLDGLGMDDGSMEEEVYFDDGGVSDDGEVYDADMDAGLEDSADWEEEVYDADSQDAEG